MKIRVALIAAAVAVLACGSAAIANASEYAGVSSRLNSADSRYEHAKHPQLGLVSVMLNWSSVEPAKGTFNWSALQPSIDDARLHGYRLIVRIMCGQKAPIWIYTDPANPVTRLDLIPEVTCRDPQDGAIVRAGIALMLAFLCSVKTITE